MNSSASRLTASLLGLPLAFLACSSELGDQERAEGSPFVEGEQYPGGDTTNTLLFGVNALSRHVENITPEHESLFFSGDGFFHQPWVEAPASTAARDGLGPLFNARSCEACHDKDGRGRPPLTEDEGIISILFRVSIGQDENEMPIGDEVYGGQVQPLSNPGIPAEATVSISYEEIDGEYPDGATYTLLRPSYELAELAHGQPVEEVTLSPRVAPGMQGLGLLEAIPMERLEELADEDDSDGDGISGRIRRVPSVDSTQLAVGRFGWKSEQPTVRQQSAGAFLGDMGLTSSLFPDEGCTGAQVECLAAPSGVDEDDQYEVTDLVLDRVVAYSSLIAVPARAIVDTPEVLEGKALFMESGCDSCHTASHVTGEHPEFEELSGQTIFPYTDLLLHDMGEGLADGEGASRIDREWRTPPLWALRFYPVVNGHDRLLHDGRARGVEEAILWHEGEGEVSRDAFLNLSAPERALLVQFVESL